MPCDSSYLAPNSRESGLQEAAQLYQYVLKSQGKTISKALSIAAKDIYCTFDCVAHLCQAIKKLSPAQLEDIMYDGRNPMARRLADWWEEHQKADKQRIAREKAAREAEIKEAKAVLKKHGVL